MRYFINVYTRAADFGPGRKATVLDVFETEHGARSFAQSAPRGHRYDHTIAYRDGAVSVVRFDFDDEPLPPADRARQPEAIAA